MYVALIVLALSPLLFGFWSFDRLLKRRIEMDDGSWERMGSPFGYFHYFGQKWWQCMGLRRELAFFQVVAGAFEFLKGDQESQRWVERTRCGIILFGLSWVLWTMSIGILSVGIIGR